MSNNRNKKIFAGSMAAVLLLGASSLAWFTDRTEGAITGQAGNLCIELSDIEANLDHLAPGDREEIKFEYVNLGSLSMDTRVTYALSYELDDEVASVIENDLDKIATLTIGDDELVLTADNNNVKGTFESDTLKGSKEDIGLNAIEEVLEFHFDESVGNIGQLMKFKLDVIVEGKQNRNNPAWSQVHKTTINFGGDELEVVPTSACNVVEEVTGATFLLFDASAQEKIQNFIEYQAKSNDYSSTVTLTHYGSYYTDEGYSEKYVKDSMKVELDDISRFDITEYISDWLENGETEHTSDFPDYVGIEVAFNVNEHKGYVLTVDEVIVGIGGPKHDYVSGNEYDFIISASDVHIELDEGLLDE